MKIAVISLVFSLCSFSLTQFAEAETIDCGPGDVQCLIAAIHKANAAPQQTVIQLAGGTYLLTIVNNDTNGPNGLPSITSSVTIRAGDNGATLARAAGAPSFRFFYVELAGDLTLAGLTLTEGGGTHVTGGAIFNDHGTLATRDTTLALNHAGVAGGIYNNGGSATFTRTFFDRNLGETLAGVLFNTDDGEVHISQSRLVDNVGFLGNLVALDSGTISIDKTTFFRNGAEGALLWIPAATTAVIRDSAFIENFSNISAGAVGNSGTTRVENATFARNRGGRTSCAGIVSNSGSLTFVNSTFAENEYTCPDPSIAVAIVSGTDSRTLLQNTIVSHNDGGAWCRGIVISLGSNLIGDSSGCDMTLQFTDLVGDVGLETLTDNGTPGNTHFPLSRGSRAIDAAENAACSKKDQIGQARKPRCDIGAIEFK